MAKMRKPNWVFNDDVASALIEYIEAMAKENLEGVAINAEDAKHYERAFKDIRPTFNLLGKLLKPLEHDPVRIDAIYQTVGQLVAQTLILSLSSIHSKNAQSFLDKIKAMNMRSERAKAPEELALVEVIKTVRGDGPSEKPNSEASKILKRVNLGLKDKGFDTVLVDKVRRRLEKFPRS